jgi:phage baseplate assembly protein gpV
MASIIELIRRVVQQELARNRTSLLGVVSAVYPHESDDDQNNLEADVQLKYEGLELRRVPIAVGHVGVAATPRVGDLVLVQFVAGDLNQPVISGRFYHADDRPPLHKADEIVFEHRVPDGTLNHLRFAADGSILIQRDVTDAEQNQAKATIKLDPDGNIELAAEQDVIIRLTRDRKIEIIATDKPIEVTCSTLTLNGDLKIQGDAGSTTISGNEITGA